MRARLPTAPAGAPGGRRAADDDLPQEQEPDAEEQRHEDAKERLAGPRAGLHDGEPRDEQPADSQETVTSPQKPGVARTQIRHGDRRPRQRFDQRQEREGEECAVVAPMNSSSAPAGEPGARPKQHGQADDPDDDERPRAR